MLEIKDLRFVTPEGREILKGINLTIPEGKLIALTGPNGGGKTTLAKMIAGVEKRHHRHEPNAKSSVRHRLRLPAARKV